MKSGKKLSTGKTLIALEDEAGNKEGVKILRAFYSLNFDWYSGFLSSEKRDAIIAFLKRKVYGYVVDAFLEECNPYANYERTPVSQWWDDIKSHYLRHEWQDSL